MIIWVPELTMMLPVNGVLQCFAALMGPGTAFVQLTAYQIILNSSFLASKMLKVLSSSDCCLVERVKMEIFP